MERIRRSPAPMPFAMDGLLAAWIGPILCSLLAFNTALWLADGGLKRWIIAATLASLPFLYVLYPHVKHFLLFGWILTLTYNRQYFTFEGIFGKHGSQGVYWIVSDVFLIGLLLIVVYERVLLRREAKPVGRRFWPWYLPFVLACCISMIGSARPEWGAIELLRIGKFGLVIWYVSRHIRGVDWWVCLISLAAAMTFQSAVGVKEIATGRSGVIGIEQAPKGPGKFSQVFSQESFYGSIRATGTMNHPPNLACYILQVLPIPLSLLLGSRRRKLQWLAFLLAAAGAVGLACTLSRWPWMLAAVQAVLLCGAMVVTLRVSLLRMCALVIMTIVLAAIGLFPIRDKIMKRFTGDFKASVDQRTESSRVAMRMIMDNPVTGLGLNNSAHHLVFYFPKIRWAIENDEFLVSKVNARALAVVGNGFLYVPVETGIVGLLGFLIYLFGVGVVCWRALAGTTGDVQLACLGLVTGVLGVVGQQVVDFSYWVDPLYFTFALAVGLLNVAPGLFPPGSDKEDGGLGAALG